MKRVCIIPARGGSKRIPGKNIKDFLGKPIIAYSIEVAIKSELFDEVMVSTDDAVIAEVGKSFGAKIPFFRSEGNADDHATLADVITEVVQSYHKLGQNFNYACCILPTAPLVQVAHLVSAYQKLAQTNFDSIRPVVRFNYPIQRALKLTEDGAVNFFYPKHTKTRSQDLEEAYHDAGHFYWMKLPKGPTSTKKAAIVIHSKFVQDIDTPEDWELAELKYKILSNR